MADIEIRKYRDNDAEAVKEILALGMAQHVPSTFMHILKQPLTLMVLMFVFLAHLTGFNSFLLTIIAVTLLLAVVWLVVIYACESYIDTSFKTDLNHITETYMEQRNSCFWVAEIDGRVVGTVACLPAEKLPECLQLKRLSVCRSHRGMGIAKALCWTVADFAHDRGYAAIILYTSTVQTDAQKLYEHMGYSKRVFATTEIIARIVNFTVFEYRLDLHGNYEMNKVSSN